MRPLALEPRQIRRIMRDVESSHEELTAAAAQVEAPRQTYPWHDLVERGVAALLRDVVQLVEACRRLTGRLEDSLVDFEELDGHIGDAARVRR